MYMYEKEGKLCIVFTDKQLPAETPDVIIYKDEVGKIILQVGDQKIEGNPQA